MRKLAVITASTMSAAALTLSALAFNASGVPTYGNTAANYNPTDSALVQPNTATGTVTQRDPQTSYVGQTHAMFYVRKLHGKTVYVAVDGSAWKSRHDAVRHSRHVLNACRAADLEG